MDLSCYVFLSVFARISPKIHYMQKKKGANYTFSAKLGEQQQTEMGQSLIMPCAKLQDLCLSLCRWTFLC